MKKEKTPAAGIKSVAVVCLTAQTIRKVMAWGRIQSLQRMPTAFMGVFKMMNHCFLLSKTPRADWAQPHLATFQFFRHMDVTTDAPLENFQGIRCFQLGAHSGKLIGICMVQ